MPTLLERVAQLAAGVRFADMAPEHVRAAKRLVLDTLGCALGAVGSRPSQLLRPLLSKPDQSAAAARVWGTGEVAPLEGAILANGILVRYLDYMDVYWSRDICHPSENIPVALCCAEASKASGQELIEAIVAAYEVQVRLADALSFDAQSLHHVSAAGFVAPLIMARLWKLPIDRAAHASALGGFRHLTHATLARGELSMAKALAYASAASECVLSTRLAAAGYTGPLAILEQLGAEGMDVEPGTACVTRVSLKQYPVQFALQAPIEAALELRKRLGPGAALRELSVEMPARACRRTADPAKFNPQSRETADHSLPCCVALALADGRVDHGQFDSDRWRDADIRRLTSMIRVTPSEELEGRWPDGRPARITAMLRDGSQQSVLIPVPLGDRTRPMDDDAVVGKFIHLAEPVIGASRAARVVDMTQRLDTIADVSALTAVLALGEQGRA
jgi:2-methylcitrate dehydratase